MKRITLIVSHAHMDHWEGLKDCGWFWGSAPPSGLELEIFGPAQALDSVERAYERPSFMPLEVLAEKSLDLRSSALEAGETVDLRKWRIETRPLNHYSGSGESIAYLDTLGLRITPLLDAEPVVSYLCDHEPTAATESDAGFLLSRANLALVDANFSRIVDHAFGHGSQEHTANLARSFPHVLFLATHHGPGVSDDRLISGFEHHARGLSNIRLAIEGTTLRWDSNARVFVEPKLELVQT